MYTIGHYIYMCISYTYTCLIYVYIPDLTNFPAFPQAAEAQSLLLFCQGEVEKNPETNDLLPWKLVIKGRCNRLSFWGKLGQFLQKGQAVGFREDNIPETQMLHWEMEKLLGRVLSFWGWLTYPGVASASLSDPFNIDASVRMIFPM